MHAATKTAGGELVEAPLHLHAARSSAASTPLSNDDAAAAVVLDDGPPAAAPGSAAEEEDDEQVERFYALLANIRALRGSYSAGAAGGTVKDGGDNRHTDGGGATKRQARCADPPWRPAFRLEDFEGAHADTARAETTKLESKDAPPSPEKQQPDGEDCAAEGQPRRAVASPHPTGAAVQLRRSKKRKFERLI